MARRIGYRSLSLSLFYCSALLAIAAELRLIQALFNAPTSPRRECFASLILTL
jgi:hypothetical protein